VRSSSGHSGAGNEHWYIAIVLLIAAWISLHAADSPTGIPLAALAASNGPTGVPEGPPVAPPVPAASVGASSPPPHAKATVETSAKGTSLEKGKRMAKF
jgi:hypothetical protein